MKENFIASIAAVALACSAPLHAADAPAPAHVFAGEKDGLGLESEDGAYRLKLAGWVQLDGRFFPGAGETAADTFVLRRVRPSLAGTLARRIEFTVTPDFGLGTTVVLDAYADLEFSPLARVRFGKSKTPFGLERLQWAGSTVFVERALPTSLAPNRDLGVQLHGELRDGVAGYALALGNGAADGGSSDLDDNDGKDLTARVVVRPFRRSKGHPLRELLAGFALNTGEASGAPAGYRATSQRTFFAWAGGVAGGGRRLRYSPQASLYTGPFAALAEWTVSRQELRGPRSAAEVEVKAWQATASWVLTGEDAGPRGVRPARPFGPEPGWGALEVAARVHGLSVGEEAFTRGLADLTRSARKAFAWAAGLNWYLNRHLRLSADYERTRFEGGAALGAREAENTLFFRAQLAY